MNDKIFGALGAFGDQYASLLGPSRELNKLAVAKMEQLVALQLASMRDYADLNLGQIKAAADIAGPDDLKDYLQKQQEFLKTVAEKMAGDAQAVAALGKEFAEEAQKIAMSGVSTMAKGKK